MLLVRWASYERSLGCIPEVFTTRQIRTHSLMVIILKYNNGLIDYILYKQAENKDDICCAEIWT